jgi:enoyl-CoA hydratase
MLQLAAGRKTAAAAVLFGEVLDGGTAAATGLAWRCVDDEALLDSARQLARQAAENPPELARRTKQTLQTVSSLSNVDDAVDVELEAQVWSMAQPDFAERLAALQARISSR